MAIDRQLKEEKAQSYSEYAEFGMTYDMTQNLFLYDGKVVRYFYDEEAGLGFTDNYNVIEYADYDKYVDLTAVRSANGKLTGLSVAGKKEYDERTARINEMINFYGQFETDNTIITRRSFSASESASDSASSNYPDQSVAFESGGNKSGVDTCISYNANYVDDTLNAYADYGISYDKETKQWMYKNKIIALFVDKNYTAFINNLPFDDTGRDYTKVVEASDGVFLRVIRKADGSIDKIVEMTVDEAANALNTMFH